MDLDLECILPNYHVHGLPIPDAILADYSTDCYLICWKPNDAGVILSAPGLVKKEYLAKGYPHIVEAWEVKQEDEENRARGMERSFTSFTQRFLDWNSDGFVATQSHEGACDQSLLPGMIQHWGEVHECESHPPGQAHILVCKGCRVSHYAQECRTFDRTLIMARGARFPVCGGCADTTLEGAQFHNCVCDGHWTCYHCREADLDRLAKAREKHTKGRCGRCSEPGLLVQHVEFCVHCQGWRVYAASNEDLRALGDGKYKEESFLWLGQAIGGG
jgi:hypothetical protein